MQRDMDVVRELLLRLEAVPMRAVSGNQAAFFHVA
jgi:hypothetical protein